MKRLLKTASLLSLITIPFAAHAEGPTDGSNFSPRLKLQSRYSLTDSYRKNQMDLISATARFGLNYRYKNVSGTFEAQAGSASDGFTNANITSGASTSNAPTDNGQQSLFTVRRANLGLELIKSDPATVTFVMGRDHLTGSVYYAPDALTQVLATNLDNVAAATGEDGIGLKYAGKFDFAKFGLVLGYYNNSAVATQVQSSTNGAGWFGNTSIITADNSFAAAPKSQSRAMVGILNADIPVADGVVEGKLGYSTQPSAVTKVTTSTNYTSRDVSNMEFSLGYNYNASAIKGGLWYQTVSIGKTQSTTSGTGGVSSGVTNDFSYTASTTDDSATINTLGFGVVGSSKLFGMTGLLVDGDELTYGLGYQTANGQIVSGGGTAGVDPFNNQKLTTDIYNYGAGYRQGNFTLEVNYATITANYAIYSGTDGVISKKDANILYLVATLAVI